AQQAQEPAVIELTPDADASVIAGDASGPLVSTSDGLLQGMSTTTPTRIFLGIPYAEPPVGALRLRAPRPARRWSGIRRADTFGPACVQPQSVFAAEGPRSEDCLSLNVYAGNRSPNAPVMVFIHGGSFVTGAGAQFDGQRLAETGQAVVVTINYRLGALGFISLPELDAEDPAAPSGNNGFRDQQLALQWVQKNIRAFGGDPTNVTVFGESAGAVSTCIQMVSPLSRTLAGRFIMESGSCDSTGTTKTLAQARLTSARVVSALCAGRSDVVACLRAAPAEALIAVPVATSIFDLGWLPVINPADPLLPQPPKTLIATGNYNRGASITGSNARELGLFQANAAAPVVGSIAELGAQIDALFGPLGPRVRQQYSAATDAEANDVLVRLGTDLLFRCPARAFARRSSAQGSSVYLYHFEEGLAFHAFELPYVFGTPNPRLGAATLVEPVRQQFQTAFTSFAATGVPQPRVIADNGAVPGVLVQDLPPWPKYTAETDRHISIKSDTQEGTGLSRADCDFLESVGLVQ
ncbi:MAG TPA: carboxylesterase family protein, partial [Polyangiales bacterium]